VEREEEEEEANSRCSKKALFACLLETKDMLVSASHVF
jgi:hypothetical protein